MVDGGITVYNAFLVIAAFCVSGTGPYTHTHTHTRVRVSDMSQVVAFALAWFVIPDQDEMFERAEQVLGMDPRPTHGMCLRLGPRTCRIYALINVGMSLWRKVKATFNVMGQYPS